MLSQESISEVFVLREDMRRLLIGQQNSHALSAAAQAAGMRSMYQSGLTAVFLGQTSVEEILAVVRND